ncbi:MAG: hypothetical protein Ct9H300mP16_07650 [Pseudomonadota bacterium]|nr:MAG: hypothetical protein Ct9H300mP16_07650 [Pseudomonadota bacterium]
MNLGRFPRLRFGHLPTPLEPLENLSRELGGPDIWIKRDDCTGLPPVETKPANSNPDGEAKGKTPTSY